MAEASSADCKKFIEDNAAAMGWPQSGAWKRRSKSKTEEGWLRVFDHGLGVQIAILEPTGRGVAGLRVAGTGARSPAGGTLGKSESAIAIEAFAAASEGLRSAMRWVDAMRVIGGKRASHAPDAGPGSIGSAPKSWTDFKRDYDNFSGNKSTLWVRESLQSWVEEGMADPSGRRLALSRMSWCFSNDADYLEAHDSWSPGDGVGVFAWPADVGEVDPSCLPNPFYEMPYSNQMECVWCLGVGGASGKESMLMAWDQLRADGVPFDLAGQKKHGRSADYDEDEPLHVKVHRIIPELAAAKEAKALERAAATASASSKRGRSL